MRSIVTFGDDVFAEQIEVLPPARLQRGEIASTQRIIIAVEMANQLAGDGVRIERVGSELCQ